MAILNEIRDWHRPLMLATGLMTLLAIISAAGVVIDDRTILGESVWIKPLKFGFSFAVYGAVLAWLLTMLVKARGFGWWIGTVFAFLTVIEVGVITIAAARGTFSHFNTASDPVNQVGQAIFSYGIPVLFCANLMIAILVLFQRTGSRPVTSAMRWGLGLATAGMFLAFYLVGHSGGKRTVEDANGETVRMSGGHGIGDPDGTGMPLTNWSTSGGDLRVPHFIGLHGIHVLLVVVLLLSALSVRSLWLREERIRARVVTVVAAGYSGVLAVVTWQAMRGQSFAYPDTVTLTAFGTVALLTLGGLLVIRATSVRGVERSAETGRSQPRLRR